MKIILSVIFVLSIFFNVLLNAQTPDGVEQISVPVPPPVYFPEVTNSSIVTVNGFDNMFLGNDNGEVYIAVNPYNPLKQVCAYNLNCFYYTINGIDWSRSYPTFSGYPSLLGDPVMTYDRDGNLYYSQLYNIGQWGIVVAKSTDNGATFSQYTSAHQTTVGLADKEWITADRTNGPFSNNIYIGWRQIGITGVMGFTRSTDHGATWSPYIQLTGTQGAYISIGPKGSVNGGYLYFACNQGNTIRLHRSEDGGASFQSMGHIITGIIGPGIQYGPYYRWSVKSTHIRTDQFPRMATDNSNTATRGNVYITYSANQPGYDTPDIYFIRSTDYGVTWSSSLRVNDDVTTTDQWMPTIAVDDSTGKIFISWYDSRNDTANILTDVYGAVSTDGGISFIPNSRISNGSFNPNIMVTLVGSDASYIGDYIGIASTGNGKTSVTGWMDNRNNSPQGKQSYAGYYPDFALLVNPAQKDLGNNDSAIVTITIPGTKGLYNDRVKFVHSMDTLPVAGSFQFSFVNGKDSITAFPDSIRLKIKSVGNITPGIYYLSITGSGSNGTPVHRRKVQLNLNSTSVHNISHNIPGEFKLYQNYPNPFNPSTNIKYQITNNSFLTLKVYDILGKEVATLVNEYQKAGVYEVQFSNEKISSGVYFYKIEAGNFIETKRMILLK